MRKNHDLFIVSHNKTETIIEHLEKEKFDNDFKGIFGSDKIPVQKPDPMALQPALETYKSRKRDEFLMMAGLIILVELFFALYGYFLILEILNRPI